MKNDWWETSTAVGASQDEASSTHRTYVVSVLDGPEAGTRLSLDAAPGMRALVGKSPACELRVSDPSVSRRHASLEVTPRGIRVTDLDQRDGRQRRAHR